MKYLVEFVKADRANDVYVEFDNLNEALIYVSQNGFTDDGYRIIKYRPGNGAQSLREWEAYDEEGNQLPNVSAKAQLNVQGESSNSSTIYDTLAEAETARDALNASDGYQLIDLEQPVGRAPSILLDSRPSLWHNEEESSYVASRQNGHNRNDSDRF